MPVAPNGVRSAMHLLDGVKVLDDFVDERLRALLLESFAALEEGCKQSWSTIMVPVELETCMKSILIANDEGIDFEEYSFPSTGDHSQQLFVPMPARVAKGSTHMHHDEGFDSSGAAVGHLVHGYVAVLYLGGSGSLVIDCGSGERAIDVKPGRLILWPNRDCLHRLDASEGDSARTMIGPVHLTKHGSWQRAGYGSDFFWMERAYEDEERRKREAAGSARKAEEEQRRLEEQKKREEAFVLQLSIRRFDPLTRVLKVQATTLAGEVETEVEVDIMGTLGQLRKELGSRSRATLTVDATKLSGADTTLLSDTPLLKGTSFERDINELIAKNMREQKKTKMKEEHYHSIRQVFKSCDVNGDGSISFSEFKTTLQLLDPTRWPDTRVEDLFRAMDTSRDAKIDFDEMLAWLYEFPRSDLWKLCIEKKPDPSSEAKDIEAPSEAKDMPEALSEAKDMPGAMSEAKDMPAALEVTSFTPSDAGEIMNKFLNATAHGK